MTRGKRACSICGAMFDAPPSSTTKTCGPSCATTQRSRSNKARRIRHNAKIWHLIKPSNEVIRVRNLEKFIRENPDEFDGTAEQASAGIRRIYRWIKGKTRVQISQWKGWRILDVAEPWTQRIPRNALIWTLLSPGKELYKVTSLKRFVNDNPEKFDGTAKQAYDGLCQVGASMRGRRRYHVKHWKGWRILKIEKPPPDAPRVASGGKLWEIQKPNGEIIRIYNLMNFVRKNEEKFPTKWATAYQAFWRLRTGDLASWHGWRVLSVSQKAGDYKPGARYHGKSGARIKR